MQKRMNQSRFRLGSRFVCEPNGQRITWRSHWRHMANTMNDPCARRCGLMLNYFTTAFMHYFEANIDSEQYVNYRVQLTRQQCITGSVPGTPCTKDSSSLGARRRLRCDATNTTQQGRYPAHDEVMTSLAATVSTCLHYVQI